MDFGIIDPGRAFVGALAFGVFLATLRRPDREHDCNGDPVSGAGERVYMLIRLPIGAWIEKDVSHHSWRQFRKLAAECERQGLEYRVKRVLADLDAPSFLGGEVVR